MEEDFFLLGGAVGWAETPLKPLKKTLSLSGLDSGGGGNFWLGGFLALCLTD